jgi:hypothetical protein
LSEWKAEDDNWTYLVGFSNSQDIAPQEYFKLDGSVEDKFMAVSDFDLLFEQVN